MNNNIKTFLGKRPIRVIEDIVELSEKHQNAFESVNNYLMEAPSSAGVFPNLGITRTSSFRLACPIIQLSKEDFYIPIRCGFEINLMANRTAKMRSALYAPSDLFYIKGLVPRPNLGHLMKHFQKLLSSPYGGRVDGPLPGSMGNRYTVCLTNAKIPFIITLLHLATSGGGKVIDHSWIAPLQDLLEVKEEEELKKKTRVKTNRARPLPEEDEPMDLPTPTMHEFHASWPQFTNSLLDKEIPKELAKEMATERLKRALKATHMK